VSLFDEQALRQIVAEELRRVLREERGTGGAAARDGEYLPVAQAAARAAVAPATIRSWMAQGRLRRYYAGRELRVLATELVTLMRTPSGGNHGERRPTPEEEAAAYMEKRRRRLGNN
jgi:hypothetical protein